jgi:DNA-binding LacI/PurR family transcriptional regulator
VNDLLTDIALAKPASRLTQITSILRGRVLSGELAPNSRLPTTKQLAKAWDVHVTTVQAALAPLVREGLLLRRPRLGTVVRGIGAPLGRVALLQPAVLSWRGSERFTHRLERTLAARLAGAGVETQGLVDDRPEAERDTPLPELLRLARSRQIDAVIACETNPLVDRWLGGLPVPVVTHGSGMHPHQVWFDLAQFARAGVERLVARGCRSVGLISVLPARRSDDTPPALHGCLHEGFLAAAQACGATTAREWIRVPASHPEGAEAKAERFGFDALRSIWSSATRPEGLLVFTDLAARGALLGLQEFLGGGSPPPRLVLHRNPELGLFSPLPADFLDTDVVAVADALIAQVQARHRGRLTGLELLPFNLVRHDAVQVAEINAMQ